jgi:hypothetical protein
MPLSGETGLKISGGFSLTGRILEMIDVGL